MKLEFGVAGSIIPRCDLVSPIHYFAPRHPPLSRGKNEGKLEVNESIRAPKGSHQEKFRIDAPPRCFQENENRKQETDETPQEKNGPADDHPTSNIPVVDLDKNTDGGADLHRVRDALLYAGSGVAMHTNKKDVKEEREAWTS
ncbi:hypothetical protein R1flu_021940 [Riccia fluitans]|uniref:Uncharacterized protein n=1 Tax=Riccia fluitans TaxID=41844 RepID=A0ABD1ZRY7_9MARC